MTESEEMQKKTQEIHAVEKFEEISAYIERLFVKMEAYMKRSTSSDIIYLLAWLLWVVGAALQPDFEILFRMGWLFALIYQFYCTMRLNGVFRELDGAFKILELLGFIQPRDGNRGKKKLRVWERGKELVREWTTRKQEMQKEAYAGA